MIVGEEVRSFPTFLFLHCDNFTTLYYHAKHASDCRFGNALTDVYISEGVETIPANFASGSSVLTSITLPASVDSIGSSAFEGSGLKEIHCQNPLPPVVAEDYVFYEVTGNCTLYVPVGSKSLYAEAQGWNEFAEIVEEETQAIATVYSPAIATPISYSIDGRTRRDSAPGFYVERGKKMMLLDN